MKKIFILLVFIIFALLLSNRIIYSQTNFWEPASIVLKNPNLHTEFRGIRSLAVANNGDVWAVTPEGIFVSTDNGNTWVPKNNGLPSEDITFSNLDGATYTFHKAGLLAITQ